MHELVELGLFVAKTAILVIGFVTILGAIFFLAARGRSHNRTELEVEKVNDHYKQLKEILRSEVLDKKELKALLKKEKKEQAKQKSETSRKRVFILDFDGDIRASAVENLREEVTGLLTLATSEDEVVVRLESPGGMVSPYGLAASQLKRFRDANIKLTICVDEVAASGGYLMACVGHQILAAPFAVVGSIGVVAGVPNFHRLLEKHQVDYREVTSGEFKRTVSLFGEVTPGGLKKFKEQIEDVHTLFKNFVTLNRPQVNIEQVATGEHWYGHQALALKLVDRLETSDEYLFNRSSEADLYSIRHHHRISLQEKIAERFGASLERSFLRLVTGILKGRLGY
jgi:serine protease SohB